MLMFNVSYFACYDILYYVFIYLCQKENHKMGNKKDNIGSVSVFHTFP